jgi:hypothetical protein
MSKRAVVLSSVVAGVALAVLGIAPAGAAQKAGQLQIVDTGFSTRAPGRYESSWRTTIATVVTNPTKQVASIRGKWTMKDAAGAVIDTSSTSYPYALPGGTVYLTTQESTDSEVASVDFELDHTIFVSQKEFETLHAPDSVKSRKLGVSLAQMIKISDARYHGHGNGDAAGIIGSFTSSAKVPVSDVVISCAMFEDGKVIGGALDDYNANVPPKQAVGFDARLEVDGLSPDEVRCGSVLNTGSDAIVGSAAKLTVTESALLLGESISGVDFYGLSAAVRNSTKKIIDSAWAEFDVLDASGRIIGHIDDLVGYVLPGDTSYGGSYSVPNYFFDGTPKSVRATVGGDAITPGEFAERNELPVNQAELTFTNLAYDDSGGRIVYLTGTMAAPNTSDEIDAKASCAVFKNGKLSAFGFDYVTIPAGGSTGVEARVTPGSGPGEVRCYGNVTGVTSTTPTTSAQ